MKIPDSFAKGSSETSHDAAVGARPVISSMAAQTIPCCALPAPGHPSISSLEPASRIGGRGPPAGHRDGTGRCSPSNNWCLSVSTGRDGSHRLREGPCSAAPSFEHTMSWISSRSGPPGQGLLQGIEPGSADRIGGPGPPAGHRDSPGRCSPSNNWCLSVSTGRDGSHRLREGGLPHFAQPLDAGAMHRV
jgi:hypothetical protein